MSRPWRFAWSRLHSACQNAALLATAASGVAKVHFSTLPVAPLSNNSMGALAPRQYACPLVPWPATQSAAHLLNDFWTELLALTAADVDMREASAERRDHSREDKPKGCAAPSRHLARAMVLGLISTHKVLPS